MRRGLRSRAHLCAGAILAGAVAACGAHKSPPATPAASTNPAITLSSAIPGTVAVGTDDSLAGLQGDFDIFSWNSFIAVNWPRGQNGSGDPSKKIGAGGDTTTVWEGWQDAADTFLAGGAAPAWGRHAEMPAVCRAVATPGVRVLTQIGKTPGLLEESTQPFDTGPLIDQHGAFARFDIVMNRSMFDDIVANRLYSKAGQQAFNKDADFACGTAKNEGAIMVKAAWKILADPAERARFHAEDVLVYTPATENPKVPESCTRATVGLVGLHIAHKVTHASQWVWSTFEHVDNAPTAADVKNGTLKPAYNYYNAACKTCPVNTAAPRPWNPVKGGPPTQVVREDVLPPFAVKSATMHNATARTLLSGVSAKSVWQYYELISTQWPTNSGECAAKPADPFGTPAPVFLANTTLETFVQGSVQNVSSSCIHCHGNAAMTTGKASDFTYLLQRAK